MVAVAVVGGVFVARELSTDDSQRVDSIGLDELTESPNGDDSADGPATPTPNGSADADDSVSVIAVDPDGGATTDPSAPDSDTTTGADPSSSTSATSTDEGDPALPGDDGVGQAETQPQTQPPAQTPGNATPGSGQDQNPTAGPSTPGESPSSPAPSGAGTEPGGSAASTNPPTTTQAGTEQPTSAQPAVTAPPAPPPQNIGDLAQRLYPGWCRSGPLAAPGVSGGVTTVAPGQSIQAAIDATSSGVVELQTGVHTISRPVELKSRVVLRGASRQAVIRTSSAMEHMVEIGGGFTGAKAGNLTDAKAYSRSITIGSGTLSPGLWLIGSPQGGQMVRILSVNGNTANLELPLTRDFSGSSIAQQKDPISRAGLERVTLQPRHTVRDVVVVRSALDVWVDDIETDGSGGQVRSAVYLRQAYRVGVYDSRFVTARELGDGGQGYGINIANNSSNSLIRGNRLERLRHAILLHAGAAGNVVRDNVNENPRHPNFVEGGPADISFHGYASGNLVMGNSIERIQINDAGTPGPNNAIVGNTLRVGPLTLDNNVDNLTLLGNDMQGSVEALRSKTMPPVDAVSTAGNRSPERQYWTYGYDPFGRSGDTAFNRFGDGILDWGSGDDVYVDPDIRAIDVCNL